MKVSRIAESLEPFLGKANDRRLTVAELANISTYIDLLLRWNARINLTAIRDPEEIVTRHFGESFFAARHLFPTRARVETGDTPVRLGRIRLADVGSGAGFPGVPIKLWAPEISLTLIESNQKKAVFLREVCRALGLRDLGLRDLGMRDLGLRDVNIENVRAETVSPAAFDVVTLRAVEHFTDASAVAANLVRPSGRLALLISSTQVQSAKSALSKFHWSDANPIPMSESRLLLIGTKEIGTNEP